MYLVYSVYYKNGEWDLNKFETKMELKTYLAQTIMSDSTSIYSSNAEYDTINKAYSYICETSSLNKLIEVALSLGEHMIDTERGYGIVSVVKGVELFCTSIDDTE